MFLKKYIKCNDMKKKVRFLTKLLLQSLDCLSQQSIQ